MKKLILRVFFVFFLLLSTTGFIFDCEGTDDLQITNNGYVKPEVVKIGQTVFCFVGTSEGSGFAWEFVSKPEQSTTSFDGFDGNYNTSFIPDVVGIYKLKFTVIGDGGAYNSGRLPKEFTVTALDVELKAIAGQDQEVNIGTLVTLDGSASIGEQLEYNWRIAERPQGSPSFINNSTSTTASYLVELPGVYLVELKVTDINQLSDYDTIKIIAVAPTQNPWSELGEYPGDGSSYLVAVGDGEFGYIGLGATSTGANSQQFYKYTPPGSQGGNGTWELLNPFPTNESYLCTSFIIEDTIYVGLGREFGNNTQSNQLHKFVTTTGQWDEGIPVANFPGYPGVPSLSFVLNNNAYVLDSGSPTLYKYDPVSNSWAALNDFDGGGRFEATSFVLNSTAYLGYGSQIDFWRYDEGTDDWTAVTPLVPPAGTGTYRRSLGLSSGTHGFIIGGAETAKHLWTYNPSEGWKYKTSAIGDLVDARGFVINDIIYCGTGNNSKKWYRYDPALDQTNNKRLVSNSIKSKKN